MQPLRARGNIDLSWLCGLKCRMPSLRLRKVTGHFHAPNAYRVILTLDDGRELEIGSIGEQEGVQQRRYWSWGIDTAGEPVSFPIAGEAMGREEAMTRFKAAWGEYAQDPARLAYFLSMKTRRA